MVYTFNPRTPEAEADGTLKLKTSLSSWTAMALEKPCHEKRQEEDWRVGERICVSQPAKITVLLIR